MALTEDFLLVLGDYVHHHSSLTELVTAGLAGNDFFVQTSEAPQRQVVQSQVALQANTISFDLSETPVGAVSSGAFLCAANLFSASELAQRTDDVWDFLAERTTGRKIALCPVADPLWRRVTDRRGAREAKNMLFTQVTKKTSGFISRHLNAHISIPISKLLVETGVSPNLVTILLIVPTGLAAAYLMLSMNEYPKLALGGLLWHLAAVFDRCDGEVARVKLCESKFGAWLDTVTDNIVYIFMSFCFLIAFLKLHPEPLYRYIGLWGIGSLALYFVIMYIYLWKIDNGSLQQFTVNLSRDVDDVDKGVFYRFLERCTFMAKRDFFSFFLFLTAIANHIEIFYFFAAILYNMVLFAAVSAQHKMRLKISRVAQGQREGSRA